MTKMSVFYNVIAAMLIKIKILQRNGLSFESAKLLGHASVSLNLLKFVGFPSKIQT